MRTRKSRLTRAISPVIATIMLVAIVIILAAILFLWVQGLAGVGSKAPQVMVLSVVDDGGGQIVLEITIAEEGYAIQSLEWRVDSRGTPIAEGGLVEIYNVVHDPAASDHHNVSFRDRDGNMLLSVGDQFILSGAVERDGDAFRIASTEDGMMVANRDL